MLPTAMAGPVAICGRFANRIAGASFTLDGATYSLPANEGSKQLHGGALGFGHLSWEVDQAGGEVVFRLDSPDGDMGFPGALAVKAAYGFKGQTLYLDMTATTTKPTVVNLTNHVYWNLLGKGDILGHLMQDPGEPLYTGRRRSHSPRPAGRCGRDAFRLP